MSVLMQIKERQKEEGQEGKRGRKGRAFDRIEYNVNES